MKTVFKRRFTNRLTTKSSHKKKTVEDGVSTKVCTSTKRTLFQGNLSGLTKSIWSNRRWRRALANYANRPSKVPPEMTQEILEESGSKGESLNDFYTFDNAPKVDRFGMPFNLAVVWASKLPGGLERLSCIMMAIFLFLCILAVQLYIGTLNKHRVRSRLSLCAKPSSLEEVITFECRVTLLFFAWILSVLLAWLVLLCHFLYWCCTFRRPNAEVHLFEEGHAGSVHQGEHNQQSETSKLLDEIVTEELAETSNQSMSMEHGKED